MKPLELFCVSFPDLIQGKKKCPLQAHQPIHEAALFFFKHCLDIMCFLENAVIEKSTIFNLMLRVFNLNTLHDIRIRL